MKIKIRGKTYRDAAAAAAALGVKRGTIYTALHRGTIDGVGLGSGGGTRPNLTESKGWKPVVIGPYEWPNFKAAADDLGYCRKTLFRIVRYGKARSKADLLARVMSKSAELDAKKRKIREKQEAGAMVAETLSRGRSNARLD